MTFGLQVGKIVLVTVAQPFGTAYPVTLESLVHEINIYLNAFSFINFKTRHSWKSGF